MEKVNFEDAGVLFEIARQMKASDSPTQIDWIKAMLQRVVDGDHDGDKELFAKTWLTLERPTMREHAEIAEVKNASYERPFTDGGRGTLEALNRSWGPSQVEVVRITHKNMFGMEKNKSRGDEVIAAACARYGLVLCPPWVAIALCVSSNRGEATDQFFSDQIHVCLERLNGKSTSPQMLNIIYGKNWWCRNTYPADKRVDFFPTYLLAKPWN